MLKTYAHYLGIILCLLFIQTSPLLPLGNYGIRPDLLLLFVLCASIALPAISGSCFVFMLGYFFEALSGAPNGFFISSYLLVFASIKILRRFFNFNTLLEFFTLFLVCLTVKYAAFCFFLFFIYEHHHAFIVRTVFGETIFTILLFPLCFPLLRYYCNLQPTTTRTHGS
jgi:rod shape-determining protein MreD